jgi:hypothetical protein
MLCACPATRWRHEHGPGGVTHEAHDDHLWRQELQAIDHECGIVLQAEERYVPLMIQLFERGVTHDVQVVQLDGVETESGEITYGGQHVRR